VEVIDNDEHLTAVNCLLIKVGDMKDLCFVFLQVLIDIALEGRLYLPSVYHIYTTFEVTTLEKHAAQFLYECTLSTSLGAVDINVGGFTFLPALHQLLHNVVEAITVGKLQVVQVAFLNGHIMKLTILELKFDDFASRLLNQYLHELINFVLAAGVFGEAHHIDHHLLFTDANHTCDFLC
jgi:hypothetical protein